MRPCCSAAPTSVAVIDFATDIDIQRVREIRSYETPTRVAHLPAAIKGVVNLRGVIVPIIDLRLKLGCDSAEYNHFTVVIVLNVRGRVVGAVQVKADDPASLQQFQAAQGELSSALSRLMVVVERYPDLKTNAGFQDLRTQLEGTENRITVSRNRDIKSVQEYNTTVRQFPTNLTAMVF